MSDISFLIDGNFSNEGTLILLSNHSGSSNAGGQWAAGDEPLYYIVSPKDIVVAKPRFVTKQELILAPNLRYLIVTLRILY
jgi:hypothetical protein